MAALLRVTLFALLGGMICGEAEGHVTLVTPVAVPMASGPAFPRGQRWENGPDPQYAAERAIDGDPATFCCLMDDSCDGDNPATIPPRAAAPVTGYMIFDLGRPMLVVGSRLVGRQSGGSGNPREVDFYYFEDDNPANHPRPASLERDSGLRPLLRGHQYPRLTGGATADVLWNGVVARYVGLRVDSSYETGGGGKHFNFQIAEIGFFAGPAPPGLRSGESAPPVYVRQSTLAATLIEGRKRYAATYGPHAESGAAAEAQRAACEDFWRRLERDFPPDRHRFLLEVPCTWFGHTGWLAQGDKTELEQAAIEQALRTIGSRGNGLRAELDGLRRSAVASHDLRWLELCQSAFQRAALVKELKTLRLAIDDLAATFPGRYSGEAYRRRATAAEDTALGSSSSRELDDAWSALEQLKHDALVGGNPLLSPGKLLFVKRYTYTPGWYYAEFMRATRMGGGLFVLSLPDGRETELVPSLRGGIFDRYDLSFDGRRVVFGYKPSPAKGFRLYEVGVDGSGLRQLTCDPPDEPQRVARYALPGSPYRHTTDDFHPCFLPDGGVAFASARCERGVLCDQGGDLAVNLLHRIDGDGGHLRRLSEGALSESAPSVMNDGRILYTRWEYVDKGVIAVQALWAMRPDGTGSTEIYGNDIEDPMVFIHGRAIPGSPHLFVCTGTFHHPFAVGPILLVDARQPLDSLAPLQSLTPDTRASSRLLLEQTGHYGERFAHRRNGRWVTDDRGPLFSEPYPLADPHTDAGAGKYFLVNCNPDQPWGHASAYGLYLIDVFGNRVRIHADPRISCWQPTPLRARPRPPVLPAIWDESPVAPQATLALTDVYRGLEGVPRGAIKYLRVLEQVARPWTAQRFWPDDTWGGQHAPISMYAHIHVKIHHGVVPVQPDGSAHFTVPAQRNLFFQALDADFREVQRMRSFVNVQPGETRACIGCHEGRGPAPPHHGHPLALALPPSPLGPQPGETVPRPIHYPTDVQPVLDKHCVHCHGTSRTDAGLDLSAEPTEFFCRSYENLMQRKLLSYITEFVGPRGSFDQFTNVQPLPPRALGSSASRLFRFTGADHYGVQLSQAERLRLITWADANGPYYGTYLGRRNLKYRDLPDFRPTPDVNSARGIPEPHSTASR